MESIHETLRNARWRQALLGSLAGLLFVAHPVQAQDVCADLSNVADEAFDLYIEQLDEEFDVGLANAELCGKLTENFVKGCQTAAKDAVKCIQNQVKSLDKQNQAACKALAGDDVDACKAFYQDRSKNDLVGVASDGDDQSTACAGEQADDFYDACFFGFN